MQVVVRNIETGEFVGWFGGAVSEWPDARKFDTWNEAAAISRKMSAEWQVEES